MKTSISAVIVGLLVVSAGAVTGATIASVTFTEAKPEAQVSQALMDAPPIEFDNLPDKVENVIEVNEVVIVHYTSKLEKVAVAKPYTCGQWRESRFGGNVRSCE